MNTTYDITLRITYSYDQNGNLITQATQLKTLGAKAKKELPQAMVEAAGATALEGPDSEATEPEADGDQS